MKKADYSAIKLGPEAWAAYIAQQPEGWYADLAHANLIDKPSTHLLKYALRTANRKFVRFLLDNAHYSHRRVMSTLVNSNVIDGKILCIPLNKSDFTFTPQSITVLVSLGPLTTMCLLFKMNENIKGISDKNKQEAFVGNLKSFNKVSPGTGCDVACVS